MRILHLLAALLLVQALAVLHAAPAMSEGELVVAGRSGDGVALGRIRVRYHISSRMGEPIEKFDVLLEGAETPVEITGIRLRADVQVGGKDTGYHIEFSRDLMDKRGQWQDAATWHSPDWDRWFLDEGGHFAEANTAKRLFGTGVSLRNLQVVRVNTRKRAAIVAEALTVDRCWRRPSLGNYGEGTALTGLLPVPERPTDRNGAVAGENAKRGWNEVLDYCGELTAEIEVQPAGLAASAHSSSLCIWKTADALVLKGSFGLAKGTLVRWDLPGEQAKRVLDGAVDVELALQLSWDGKTELCRETVRVSPGQQVEMAIRLPVPQAEAITGPQLSGAGRGMVTVSVPFGQRPPRQELAAGSDPFATGRKGSPANPFQAETHGKNNPFDGQAAGKETQNPFGTKADGNTFERERDAEKSKQFLALVEDAKKLLDGRDWAGAEAKIGQALAVPGFAQDKRAVSLLQRLAKLRHQDSVNFVALLERLARLKKEILADDGAEALRQEFVGTQAKAKAIMDANPGLAGGLTGDLKDMVGLVTETLAPAENDQ